MLFVTFVRHGESADNLRKVWAGFKDAPLTNHGMNQARAVAKYFVDSDTQFNAIYASPLQRALTTGQAIFDAQPDPKPQFTISPLIREQNFGIAEGRPWSPKREPNLTLQEMYARGMFPILYGRDEKFPDGESLNELRSRAELAIDQLVMPHIKDVLTSDDRDVHVALVSHGLCISELVAALLEKGASDGGRTGRNWTGLSNTAWTRVAVEIPGLKESQKFDYDPADPPPLKVHVTNVNEHTHLDDVKRQSGGIGRTAYDPAQKDIRAFFGGGTISAGNAVPVEESVLSSTEDEVPFSNARDEVGKLDDGNTDSGRV